MSLQPTNEGLPFILEHMDKIENAQYDKAINIGKTIEESYDPKTQTSKTPAYGGSTETFDSSYSGWMGNTDDSTISDT